MVDSIGKMRREIARLGSRNGALAAVTCAVRIRALPITSTRRAPVRLSGLEEFAGFDEAGTGGRGQAGTVRIR